MWNILKENKAIIIAISVVIIAVGVVSYFAGRADGNRATDEQILMVDNRDGLNDGYSSVSPNEKKLVVLAGARLSGEDTKDRVIAKLHTLPSTSCEATEYMYREQFRDLLAVMLANIDKVAGKNVRHRVVMGMESDMRHAHQGGVRADRHTITPGGGGSFSEKLAASSSKE